MSEFINVLLTAGIPEATARACEMHWDILHRWNRRINLTSIVAPQEAARLHYLDSLSALSVLSPGSIVDLGSGGGFPGIPLACALPEAEITLVEPRRKRASFLRTAIAHLGLTHVQIIEARSEDLPRQAMNVVTRATFSEDEDVQRCLRWAAPGGQLIAWRAQPSGVADAVHPYTVAGEQRYLEVWRRG